MKNKMIDGTMTKIVKNVLDKIGSLKIDMGLNYLYSEVNDEDIIEKNITSDGLIVSINPEKINVSDAIKDYINILSDYFSIDFDTVNIAFKIQSINNNIFIMKAY